MPPAQSEVDVVFVALGSLGDVAPLATLAGRLSAAGVASCRVVTHPEWRDCLSPRFAHLTALHWHVVPSPVIWHETRGVSRSDSIAAELECILLACQGARCVVFNLQSCVGYHIAG